MIDARVQNSSSVPLRIEITSCAVSKALECYHLPGTVSDDDSVVWYIRRGVGVCVYGASWVVGRSTCCFARLASVACDNRRLGRRAAVINSGDAIELTGQQ